MLQDYYEKHNLEMKPYEYYLAEFQNVNPEDVTSRLDIHVMIGPNVTLATPMHPFLPEERNIRKREDGSFYNLEYAKPITIKDNCWLASNVVVCGGVTIGEGCVIGAGSVVTRDIPPYSLAAGNPCRVIRKITEKDHMK